jgi:hypothetical protein
MGDNTLQVLQNAREYQSKNGFNHLFAVFTVVWYFFDTTIVVPLCALCVLCDKRNCQGQKT